MYYTLSMIDKEYIRTYMAFDAHAEKIMSKLLSSTCDIDSFKIYIKQYLLAKFMLDSNTAEENIYALSVMSIKASLADKSEANLTSADLRIGKYDCHHTNSAVQKKVFFMMNLEKKLGIRLNDDAASEVETVSDLVALLYPEYVRRTSDKEASYD